MSVGFTSRGIRCRYGCSGRLGRPGWAALSEDRVKHPERGQPVTIFTRVVGRCRRHRGYFRSDTFIDGRGTKQYRADRVAVGDPHVSRTVVVMPSCLSLVNRTSLPMAVKSSADGKWPDPLGYTSQGVASHHRLGVGEDPRMIIRAIGIAGSEGGSSLGVLHG